MGSVASMEFRKKFARSPGAPTRDHRRYADCFNDVVACGTARSADYLAARLCRAAGHCEGFSHPFAGTSVRQMVSSIHAGVGGILGGHPGTRAYQRLDGVGDIDRQRQELHQFLKCFQLSVWMAACRTPSRSRSRNGVDDADVVMVRGMSADLSPASTMITGAPEKRRLRRSASDFSSSSMGSVSCMKGLSALRGANAARRITLMMATELAHNIYYVKLWLEGSCLRKMLGKRVQATSVLSGAIKHRVARVRIYPEND